MAGGDELLGIGGSVSDVRRAVYAGLLIGAGTNVYDAFSAVMSSPWSTEKFTNDPQEEAMAREYVMHAMCISWFYALAGAWIAHSIWPIAGAAVATVYMYWLYNRALSRSQTANGMSAEVPQSDSSQTQGAY